MAVASSRVCKFFGGQAVCPKNALLNYLETTIGTAMNLDVDKGAIRLAPLESVTRISVLIEDTIGSSAVREENHHLVDGLRVLGKVILKNEIMIQQGLSEGNEWTHPEHSGILEMCLRVPLLGVDKVREFGRITDEEDGSVVEDPIPVTFLGPKLDRETTRVTSSVGGSRFTTDSGETGGNADLLSNTLEK